MKIAEISTDDMNSVPEDMREGKLVKMKHQKSVFEILLTCY